MLVLLGADKDEFKIEIEGGNSNILNKGVFVHTKNLHIEIKSMGLPPHHPIVLICSEGKQSLQSAENLSKEGFINVFIVRGGVKGLIQEIIMDREDSQGGML